MSLRDWFAGKALDTAASEEGGSVKAAEITLGMAAGTYEFEKHWPVLCAKRAYAFADAMLAERERGK